MLDNPTQKYIGSTKIQIKARYTSTNQLALYPSAILVFADMVTYDLEYSSDSSSTSTPDNTQCILYVDVFDVTRQNYIYYQSLIDSGSQPYFAIN